MAGASPQGTKYKLVLRGELSDRFERLFAGMRMERQAGSTVLTGPVVDQTQLIGLIAQAQELGIEVVSLEPVGQRAAVPQACSDLDGIREHLQATTAEEDLRNG